MEEKLQQIMLHQFKIMIKLGIPNKIIKQYNLDQLAVNKI
jgi:hypothetical protein